jgi:hypothetical protein
MPPLARPPLLKLTVPSHKIFSPDLTAIPLLIAKAMQIMADVLPVMQDFT